MWLFWAESPHPDSAPYQVLVLMNLVNVDKTFLICHVTTWLMRHMTLWVGPLILSHQPARFEVHRPCGSGCFLFVTWPQYQSLTCLSGWGPLILNHHPARSGVHRPYVTGNNGVCSIGSNSNAKGYKKVFTIFWLFWLFLMNSWSCKDLED